MDEIRAATQTDVPAIAALYRSLSPRSARMRFHGALPDPRVDEVAALEPDMFGVVGLHAGRVVGEARCCGRTGAPEFAVVVADDHQGLGLGPRLLWALRAAAHGRGIERMTGVVRTDNTAMVRLMSKIGCVVVEPVRDGVVTFEVATDDYMPGWGPPDGRRRVLVEARTLFDDTATQQLRSVGYDVHRCLVPRRGRRPCPLVRLGRCRLAEDADIVVCLVAQDDDESRAIAAEHEASGRLAARSPAEWRQAARALVQDATTS